ncbi:MAG: hypothetical protein GXP15_01860 [Gammaproteobacteria bacterium]|nr:hypothetical protein [Gammaproteobacteria bacterium]
MSAISIDQRGFANELPMYESKFSNREQEQQADYAVNFDRMASSALTVIMSLGMIVATAPGRGVWTLPADGRIGQFFGQTNDGGKNWVPWFEEFYTRTGGIK